LPLSEKNTFTVFLYRVRCATLLLCCACLPSRLSAQNTPDTTALLLAGYLSHDTALAEQGVALEEARLSAGKTRLEQGFNVQLSTGTMYMRFYPESSSFEFSPSASASIPEFNSTTVDVSTTVKSDAKNANGETAPLENVKLSLSTGIITSTKKQRDVLFFKAERAVLEAERAFASQSLKSEKAFYAELQSMFEGLVQVYTRRDTQYTEELELSAVRAQGYDTSSARYRTAELEASSARHAALEAERGLMRKIEDFSRKCGLPLSLADLHNFAFMRVELPDFNSFKKETFLQIEAAAWNHLIGEKTRDSHDDFSLFANLGATFANTNFTNGTSLDAGLQLEWRGLSVSLGTAFPFSSNEYPLLQGTLKINPLAFRTHAFEKTSRELAVQKELLAIKKAGESYSDAQLERTQTLSDIVWREQERKIQAELYTELALDMETWFNRGLINETEYRQAQTNKQKADIALKQTEVEKIIYRIDITLAFTEIQEHE